MKFRLYFSGFELLLRLRKRLGTMSHISSTIYYKWFTNHLCYFTFLALPSGAFVHSLEDRSLTTEQWVAVETQWTKVFYVITCYYFQTARAHVSPLPCLLSFYYRGQYQTRYSTPSWSTIRPLFNYSHRNRFLTLRSTLFASLKVELRLLI